MDDSNPPADPQSSIVQIPFPSPLADPIVAAIFQSVDVSGLAIASLVDAVIENSSPARINKVISVTPKEVKFKNVHLLSSRIDVMAVANTGENILIKLQFHPFKKMTERNYVKSLKAVSEYLGFGVNGVETTLCTVFEINILDFVFEKGEKFHHVGRVVSRVDPDDRLVDIFQAHDIDLTKFREVKPNFMNPLHCWLTALCRAHDLMLSLSAVVELDVNLKKFYANNQGFAQFVDRYNLVVSDPQTITNYKHWLQESNLAIHDLQENPADGEISGEIENAMTIALNYFKLFSQTETDISVYAKTLIELGLPSDVVQAAVKQFLAERDEKS